MSADTEMPDEIWAWPKSEYRWSETWIEQETSGATRYIRADIVDELRTSLAEANARVRELEAVDAAVARVLVEQDQDYAQKTNAMIKRHAEQIESLRSQLSAAEQRLKQTRDWRDYYRSRWLGLTDATAETPPTDADLETAIRVALPEVKQ